MYIDFDYGEHDNCVLLPIFDHYFGAQQPLNCLEFPVFLRI